MKTTTVRFPKDKSPLLKGLAGLHGMSVDRYLAKLVEDDAKVRQVSIENFKLN